MEYATLVSVYNNLVSTTKRLEKTTIVANLLRQTKRQELKDVVYLLQGAVFPEWEERKIGFSSQLIIKAIAKATGKSHAEIEEEWSKKGDLGLVAERCITKKTQTTLLSTGLTTTKVITNLRKLAELEGPGTVERKVSLVTELLTSASPEEAKFMVKTVLEELRVGIAGGVISEAIAEAFHQSIKEVDFAYYTTGDYGEVAVLAKEGTLATAKLEPGKPVHSMLAILTRSLKEAFEALGSPLQCEYKLDGFRLQVHKKGKNIRLFTRRLENVTAQFPDVVDVVAKHIKGENFILDAEAVAIDPVTKKNTPFQNISQRIKRKYDIHELARKSPIELHVFDILYHNDKPFMDVSQEQRRAFLERLIKPVAHQLRLTKKLVTTKEAEAKTFFKEALAAGNEGLMLKKIDAVYGPGRYVGGWMKMKQVLEPLDLVILGAESGTGKRAGMLTSFVLGCKHHDTFLSCGMVSTGLKEKEEEGTTFKQISDLITPLITSKEGRRVTVKPHIVIEVAYEEIQRSPTYASGYALRFPRFLRLRIDEKDAKDANTLADVKRVYALQRNVHQ